MLIYQAAFFGRVDFHRGRHKRVHETAGSPNAWPEERVRGRDEITLFPFHNARLEPRTRV